MPRDYGEPVCLPVLGLLFGSVDNTVVMACMEYRYPIAEGSVAVDSNSKYRESSGTRIERTSSVSGKPFQEGGVRSLPEDAPDWNEDALKRTAARQRSVSRPPFQPLPSAIKSRRPSSSIESGTPSMLAESNRQTGSHPCMFGHGV